MQNPIVYSEPQTGYPQVPQQAAALHQQQLIQPQVPLVVQDVPEVTENEQQPQQAGQCRKGACKKKACKVLKKIWFGFNVLVILSQIFFFPGSFLYSAFSFAIVGHMVSKKIYKKYGAPFLADDAEKEKLARKGIFVFWFGVAGALLTLTTRLPIFLVPTVLFAAKLGVKAMKGCNCEKAQRIKKSKFHKHLAVFLVVSLVLVFTLSSVGNVNNKVCKIRPHYYHNHASRAIFSQRPSHSHPSKPSHPSHPSHPSKPSYPSHPSKPSKPSQPSKPSHPSYPSSRRHYHGATICMGFSGVYHLVNFVVRVGLFIWAIVLLIAFFIRRRALKKKAMLPTSAPATTPAAPVVYSYPQTVPQQQQPQQPQNVVPQPQHVVPHYPQVAPVPAPRATMPAPATYYPTQPTQPINSEPQKM